MCVTVGRDVLDRPVTRRGGWARVEMQHEGAVGWQFEREPGGPALMRGAWSASVAWERRYGWGRHARWNGREIAVRRR
jgi:hypothetical protein